MLRFPDTYKCPENILEYSLNTIIGRNKEKNELEEAQGKAELPQRETEEKKWEGSNRCYRP